MTSTRTKVSTAATADRMFRAMADRTRLRLLSLLQRCGPDGCCVCHLVNAVALPQPTVSRHLAYLRRSKMVRVRKQGLWSYYSLAAPRGEFHERLLGCLASCCPCVPELDRDAVRLKRSISCCT